MVSYKPVSYNKRIIVFQEVCFTETKHRFSGIIFQRFPKISIVFIVISIIIDVNC